ncbi:MAG: SpoIID/LytB domain-containing protein [Planctomycetes bacterium]|nr:SpoIID/LytB domain-containing protein [Planctomycetota bacterium]
MKRETATDSPWALLASLIAGLALVAFLSRGDGLDAATKERPRNPLIEVHLRDLPMREPIALDAEGIWELRDADGTFLARDTGMRGWLELRPEALSVAGWSTQSNHVVLQAFGDAALAIDTYRYRGRLHMRKKRKEGKSYLQLSLELPLEDYVLGVLIGEMSTQTHGVDAAHQAQAIAARTYVIYQLRRGRTMIRSTTADQRFLSTDFETKAARRAVLDTTGLILKEGERLAPTFFHADCGGHTSDGAAHEFSKSSVLRGVPDIGPAAHGSRSSQWAHTVPAEKLDRIARRHDLGEHATEFRIVTRDEAGRMLRANFSGEKATRSFPGDRMRAELGLPSGMITMFGVQRDGSLRVEGFGAGHGIGLCQLGALELARSGHDVSEILAHYYPGARIAVLTDPIQP